MATWIDEDGTIVRNAESASIERSPLRDMEIPDDLPDRMTTMLTEVKAIPDHSTEYRAAILDWVEHGAASQFALDARRGRRPVTAARCRPGAGDGVLRARPAPRTHRRAVRRRVRGGARRTTSIDRTGRTSARPGRSRRRRTGADANDLVQEAGEVYGTSWIDDVLALGGGASYGIEPEL